MPELFETRVRSMTNHTKTQRERELQTNHTNEHERKNTQWNDGKLNPGIHFKNLHDQLRFMADVQGWYNSHKCIYVIHHINKLEENTHKQPIKY